MMKTLFLNPPSFEGFDGGAGSRYQAKREVRSFWYPTWLAQVAALVPESRLIDAPARGLSLGDILPLAVDYEMLVLYTSVPTFGSDILAAESLKEVNPRLLIGFIGPHAAVSPDKVLGASPAIDYAARTEFDFTVQEVAQGKPFAEIDGLSYRRDGHIHHNRDRAILHDMDRLPSVAPVYKRDLVIEDYVIGYLQHPYMSLYTGRGCRSKCSFCLWPQTIGGHVYRTRSAQSVADEIALMQGLFPQVKEFFFDDDTFTDDRPRAEAIARLLGPMGVTWSCSAKANVPFETLKVMKDNGARVLMVGFETGNQTILNNIRKGTRIDIARRFAEDCHRLGLRIHGTFILGLPGETHDTIRETIRFARDIDPHTIQVSLAAPYPGTALHAQAQANGWLAVEQGGMVKDDGMQICALEYPDLSREEIFAGVAEFYKRFYFRPRKIGSIVLEMVQSWEMTKRRLREGVEFMRFLGAREQ